MPGTSFAEQPGFIPPPLSASDIPGETKTGDIPGEVDPNRKAARRRPTVPVASVGAWKPSDGDQAIDAMLRELVIDGALTRLSGRLRRRVVVRVARPTVRTAERVDGAPLGQRAETLLRRSGQARVAGASQAADAVLLGYVGAAPDRAGRLELRSYLVGLSLVDLVTGEKLWVGVYRVRRLLRHQRSGLPKVQPLPHDRAVDLSGHFNDHDATAAAARLAASLRRSRLLSSASPVTLRLSSLRNRTAEAFQRRMITLPLERALLRRPHDPRPNAPRIRGPRLLASIAELDAARRLRALARPGVRTRRGAELGATHILSGQLTSTVERLPRQPSLQMRTYRVTLEALSIAKNTKVWIETHTIKKVVASKSAW